MSRKIPWGTTGDWLIGILCFCLVLAFAKPALLHVLGVPNIQQRTLAPDFGIPQAKWIKVRVPSVPMPESTGVVDGYMNWPSIGLDFKCVDVHLRCAGPGRGIYDDKCSAADPMKRKFLYPPLMAYLFVWVLWLTPGVALGLWSLLVLAGSFAAAWILARAFRVSGEDRAAPALQTAVLFTLFYPVLFAFERGNNDVWVLLLYTAAVLGWMREKMWLTGLCVALAAMIKIYPAALGCGCVVAGLAMLRSDRKRALAWLGGLGGGVLAVLIPLGRDYSDFLFKHFLSTIRQRYNEPVLAPLSLPKFDPHSNIMGSSLDHAFRMSYGSAGTWLGIALWAAVLAVWCGLVWRKNEPAVRQQHALLAFLFLAALCTYLVPGTESFDYNLVTAIPLFVYFVYFKPVTVPVLFGAGASLWVLGAALPRWANEFIFGFPERSFSVPLVFQVTGMCLIVVYLIAACLKLNRGSKAVSRTTAV